MALRNSVGQRLLRALFFEENITDRSLVEWTLKEYDHTVEDKTYPSLYRLYMEANDPFEHNFAQKHFGSWDHWQLLLGCSWFKPHIEKWRAELEVKLRSQALNVVREVAMDPDHKYGLQAAKYLLDGSWVKKEDLAKGKVGRPSKAAIKAAALEMMDVNSDIDEDYNRLVKIN